MLTRGRVWRSRLKLRKRALDLQNKGLLTDLTTICKDRMDLVPLLLEHAHSPGVPRKGSEEHDGRESGSHAASAQAHEGHCPADQPQEVQQSSGTESQKRKDMEDKIHASFKTWGALPTPYLVHFLSIAEPIALNCAQLRLLCPPKSKHIPKGSLLELWECITNLQKDDEVPSCARDVQALGSAVAEFNSEQGRPCKQLLLPPDWNTGGKYKLDMQAEPPKVIKKRTQEAKEIPQNFLGAVGEASNIHISKNFSERDACLVDLSGFTRCPLNVLFPDVPYMDLGASTSAGPKTSPPTLPAAPKQVEAAKMLTPVRKHFTESEWTPPKLCEA